MARQMLPHALQATPETEAGRALQASLEGWRGEMARDRPEPLAFAAWYRALTRLVYADELGPQFGTAWRLRPLFMDWVLDGEGAHWCDDVDTSASESCAERVAQALDAAAAELAERYGDDAAAWRWGDAHYADHAHSVFRGRPLLAALFGQRVDNGGDAYTVNAAGYLVRDDERPFVQRFGPALRAIYDLADLERSLYVVSTGQSGNPLSRHYGDMIERWRDHRPFVIPTQRATVDSAAEARLLLSPP